MHEISAKVYQSHKNKQEPLYLHQREQSINPEHKNAQTAAEYEVGLGAGAATDVFTVHCILAEGVMAGS